ncbi:hypothetical protein PHISCL_09067 [Aspergillus sclerotialis]|uniref:Uncharacterized protein n=1 Tax=Aspergillus sclerotialis TaxID=2070753 RepID=A0A3A2ZBD4_9EURO|nr:hypothetical protein PHISCL_09067 [Aspergillus sclerotialis]
MAEFIRARSSAPPLRSPAGIPTYNRWEWVLLDSSGMADPSSTISIKLRTSGASIFGHLGLTHLGNIQFGEGSIDSTTGSCEEDYEAL